MTMLNERQKIIANISHILATIKLDIEHRLRIRDLSLNFFSENYFRDILNFVYGYELENENVYIENSPYIDLIDRKRKVAIQITSTPTVRKMDETFSAFKDDKFKGYDIRIFFLLEKSNPTKKTQDKFRDKYGIDLKACLFDSKDLFVDINNLELTKLVELYEKYFKSIKERYTDHIVLNLVCNKLISNVNTIQKNYDDDFGSVHVDKKLQLNNLNERVRNLINTGLDYVTILYSGDESMLTDLRTYVIDVLYKQTLIELLCSNISDISVRARLKEKEINELHQLAVNAKVDFNKVIFQLYHKIKSEIHESDFNARDVIGVIIAYFFEICDVGVKS